MNQLTTEEFLSHLPEKITIEGSFADNRAYIDGTPLSVKKSLNVRSHSPTGFNWGYGGSGPAQFALALLLLYVGKDTAQRYYQKLKFGWIAGLPRTDFIKTINLRQIMKEILEND